MSVLSRRGNEDRGASGAEAGPRASPPRSGDAGRNLVHAADHNLRITLEAVRRGGPLSRAELARLTGLSAPGIGNILKQLMADGLVEDRGRAAGRAAGFGLAREARFGLGFEVADGAATAVLADLGGKVALRRRLDLRDAAAVVDLADAVRSRLEERPGSLAGCGIALGFGCEAGDAAPLVAAVPGGAEPALAGASLAASLGEIVFGEARGGTFLSLLIDRTLGAGLVVDGRLFGGAGGRAGRIGRMRIDGSGADLDAVAGAATLPGFPFADDEAEPATGPLFDAWAANAVPHLMDAVVAVSGFLAPATVFVGGPLPKGVLARIAERLVAERDERMRDPTQPQWLPRIVPATLGRDAAAIGAAALPFLDRLLPDPR